MRIVVLNIQEKEPIEIVCTDCPTPVKIISGTAPSNDYLKNLTLNFLELFINLAVDSLCV